MAVGMLLTDPRRKNRATGGSYKAGQGREGAPGVTGTGRQHAGMGYANPAAFSTGTPKRLSYEEATGPQGLRNLTRAEREKWKVSHGIAPTAQDPSVTGQRVRGAAKAAHARGELSAQDKADQRIIDTREANRYRYEVTEPALHKQFMARAEKAKNAARTHMANVGTLASRAHKSGTRGRVNTIALRSQAQRSNKGGAGRSTGFKPRRHGLGLGAARNQERYGSPMQQRTSRLSREGWDPALIAGASIPALDAQRLQASLPGVQALSKQQQTTNQSGTGRRTQGRNTWTVR